MARNQMDKYLNQLEIRKSDYILKVQEKYKFSRFERSLSILKRASYHETIPNEIISKVELIFKLMPVHELYYLKSTEDEVDEYVKNLNELFINVLDNYEKYSNIIPSKFRENFVIIIAGISVFRRFIEKAIGFDVLPFSILAILILTLFQYRDRFWKNPF